MSAVLAACSTEGRDDGAGGSSGSGVGASGGDAGSAGSSGTQGGTGGSSGKGGTGGKGGSGGMAGQAGEAGQAGQAGESGSGGQAGEAGAGAGGSEAGSGGSSAGTGGWGGNAGNGGGGSGGSEGGSGGSDGGSGGSSGGSGGSSGGSFKIDIVYLNVPTGPQKAAFDNAAARWEEIVTGDLPDLTNVDATPCLPNGSAEDIRDIDDLVIYASLEPIDGEGKILGSAGPCGTRTNEPKLPLIGNMTFDTADLDQLESDGDLGTTILHEMGHVLGIGTIWASKALLVDPSVNNPGADTHFIGVSALAAFATVGGSTYVGQKVPVENDTTVFGEGSLDGHWREGVFDNELMTPALGGERSGNPLSLVTIASLEDIGYEVDWGPADDFTLPSNAPRQAKPTRPALKENLLRPRFQFGADGSRRALK